MSQQSMDPWRFMALVAECAQQTGIEVERAFRFMAALTMSMQGTKPATAPPPPAPMPPTPQ